MDSPREGAVVEIIELTTMDPPCIRPDRVLVNGIDVGLVAQGGVTVEPIDEDYGGVLTVTLVLLARRVEIKASPSDG